MNNTGKALKCGMTYKWYFMQNKSHSLLF